MTGPVDGHAVELGDAWLLRKFFRWEVRVMTTDLLRSQLCRSSHEVLDTSEQRKAATIEKGWS